MALNKKAATQIVGVSLMIVMSLLVATTYFYVWGEIVEFHGNIGKTQNNLLRTYHKGELALIYIDQAAKYSVYNSILPLMEKGGFADEPPCGYDTFLEDDEDYVLWQEVYKKEFEYTPTGVAYASSAEFEEETCYPKKSDIKKSLISSFNKEFNEYAEKYPIPIIPKNNYDLILEEKEGKQEIIGIATQNLHFPPDITKIREKLLPTFPIEKEIECLLKGRIPEYYDDTGFDFSCNPCPKKPRCNAYRTIKYCDFDPCNFGCEWRDQECSEMKRDMIYSIKPSFRLEASYNFMNKFDEYIKKAEEIQKNIRKCLAIGGTDSNPIDILSCTEKGKLQSEIEGIENYEASAIPPEDDIPLPMNPLINVPSKKYYTLLFRIKGPSPYSSDEITTKFAIEILDDIPPPATEIETFYNEEWPVYDEATDSLYLRWKSNPASDILAYWVYYEKIDSASEKAPTDISRMDNYVPGQNVYGDNPVRSGVVEISIEQKPAFADIVWAPLTQWKIGSSLEGDYYFVVVAQDKFLNPAIELAPKKIHIPTEEKIEEAQQEQVTDLSEFFNNQ